MINSTEFNATPCPKIDPQDINAYFTLSLDEINSSMLNLDTSWGCTKVDLTPAVKTAETITHLFLTPSVNPTALQYNREDYGREGVEDGGFDCITGDELSRIISMQRLKDVNQSTPIESGDVYMWNAITNLFEPYDLQSFVTNTNKMLEKHEANITTLQGDVVTLQQNIQLLTTRVSSLEQRVTKVESDISNILQRLSAIEGAIYNWASDKTTKIPRGTINIYGDANNTGSRTQAILSHSPNTNVIGDQDFA